MSKKGGSTRNDVWLEYPHIWKTKAQYFTYLRGSLRKMWCDYPVRNHWKTKSLRRVTAQEKSSRKFHPSTKNVGQCVFCTKWFAGSRLQVDHKVESGGCYNFETAAEFFWFCANLRGEDFQLTCVPCHKIHSHSQLRGITFEEARADKKAIAWQNDLTPTGEKEELMELGHTKEECSNGPKRRALYIKHLMEESRQ